MSTGTILDIIFLALSLIIIIKFTVRGIWRSIIDTLKVPAAFIIAYLVRIPVAKLIDSQLLRDGIVGWVRDSLYDSLEGTDTHVNFIGLYKSVPKLFTKVLSKFGLGDVSSIETLDTASETYVDDLAMQIGSSISMLISTVLAVIVLFIVILILLIILVKMSDGLMTFGAISFFNKFLGFVLGTAIAILFIWIASFILDLLIHLTHGFGGHLTEGDLNDSMVVGIVNEFFNKVVF